MARLYHSVYILQSSLKQSGFKVTPLFTATVYGSHVIEVYVGNLRLLFPSVATLYHLLYPCAIIAIDTAKYTLRTQRASLVGRKSLLKQYLFSINSPLGYLVVLLSGLLGS